MKNVTKKFLVMLMALALLVTVVPAAKAEAATLSDGTYTLTANLYVPKTSNPVKLWDAYFTSNSIPPTSGLKMNATMEVSGDTATITVPLVNSGLSLLSLGEVTSGNCSDVVTGVEKSYTCGSGSHTFDRVSEVEFEIPVSSVTGTAQYKFGTSTIHAQISMLSIAVYDSDATVGEIYLEVDYSSAVAK